MKILRCAICCVKVDPNLLIQLVHIRASHVKMTPLFTSTASQFIIDLYCICMLITQVARAFQRPTS